MILTEKCLRRNVIYDGKIIKVRRDDAVLPNGKVCVREVVQHNGGSCVLFVKDGKVLLVKQFRYAYQEELWELPAGKLNAGEGPEETARRELEEETGFVAEKLTLLNVIYPSPGYTDEKIYIYRAEAADGGAAHPDEDEFLNSELVPLEKVAEMIRTGKIRDAKTIIGVQSYLIDRENI